MIIISGEQKQEKQILSKQHSAFWRHSLQETSNTFDLIIKETFEVIL